MALSERTRFLLLGALGDHQAVDELMKANDNDPLIAAQAVVEENRQETAQVLARMVSKLEIVEDLKNVVSLFSEDTSLTDIQRIDIKLDIVSDQLKTLLASVGSISTKLDKLTIACTHMAAHVDHTEVPGTAQTAQFLTDLES